MHRRMKIVSIDIAAVFDGHEKIAHQVAIQTKSVNQPVRLEQIVCRMSQRPPLSRACQRKHVELPAADAV
jgi:hypothetical protein